MIENGLKMAGMPAFAMGEEPKDLWAITAFVSRMSSLSPDQYRRMVAAERGELVLSDAEWLPPDQRRWFELLQSRGDANLGEKLYLEYGCSACHYLGRGAGGSLAGPPLTHWSKRHYISGRLTNTPPNLVRWIVNPGEFEPETAMPDLGVTETEAWHIARYLYEATS